MQCLVAIVDDGGPVGDKDDGLIVVLQQIVEQLTLGLRIEGAGGLVEEHNAAVAQRDLRGRVRRVGVFQYGTGRLHEWFNNTLGHKYNTIFLFMKQWSTTI